MWVRTKHHLLNLDKVERISLYRTTIAFWGPTGGRGAEGNGEQATEIGFIELATDEDAAREYERLAEMLSGS